MKNIQQEKSFVIKDLETLKVVADPLRAQILEVMLHKPLTVKQVAEKLGLSPSKLYYHINLLEKHGLIQVVETRLVANLMEKLYRSSATDFEVAPELLSFDSFEGKENINALLMASIDATREDLLRSLQARTFDLEKGAQELPRRVILMRQTCRIPEERATEFAKRLSALLEDFAKADVESPDPTADLQNYALTIAYYPSFYYPEPGES
jgi:DNA-binding transcriptional ArsR family regulator